MGELNVYEDTNLDQSPLAWLQQELFAPAIPTFKGYQSRAGIIGLSATGGSVLCPNKTCAETGARLCDGLEGKCAGLLLPAGGLQTGLRRPVARREHYAGGLFL